MTDRDDISLRQHGFVLWAGDYSGQTYLGPGDRLYTREQAIALITGEEDDDE